MESLLGEYTSLFFFFVSYKCVPQEWLTLRRPLFAAAYRWATTPSVEPNLAQGALRIPNVMRVKVLALQTASNGACGPASLSLTSGSTVYLH